MLDGPRLGINAWPRTITGLTCICPFLRVGSLPFIFVISPQTSQTFHRENGIREHVGTQTGIERHGVYSGKDFWIAPEPGCREKRTWEPAIREAGARTRHLSIVKTRPCRMETEKAATCQHHPEPSPVTLKFLNKALRDHDAEHPVPSS